MITLALFIVLASPVQQTSDSTNSLTGAFALAARRAVEATTKQEPHVRQDAKIWIDTTLRRTATDSQMHAVIAGPGVASALADRSAQRTTRNAAVTCGVAPRCRVDGDGLVVSFSSIANRETSFALDVQTERSVPSPKGFSTATIKYRVTFQRRGTMFYLVDVTRVAMS